MIAELRATVDERVMEEQGMGNNLY
jgi:hypothetical protein